MNAILNNRPFLSAAALFLAAGAASAGVTFTTVLVQGQQAPDQPLGYAIAGSYGAPTINHYGQAGFNASLSGPGITLGTNSGVTYVGNPQNPVSLFRQGDQAEGFARGITHDSLYIPTYTNNGHIVLGGTVKGAGITTANDVCYWAGTTSGLSIFARENDQAPGLPAGVLYSGIYYPSIGHGGHVALTSFLKGNVADPMHDNGVWGGLPGSLSLLAHFGAQAPLLPNVRTYSNFYVDNSVNSTGKIAFGATLSTIPGGTGNNESVAYTYQNGAYTKIAYTGDASPYIGAGTSIFDLLNPLLNDSGRVAIYASVQGPSVTPANDSAIVSGFTGSLQLVAREGNASPIAGVLYGEMGYYYTLDGSNKVAFSSKLTGQGVNAGNDSAAWFGVPGSVSLIAREGAAAPGCNGALFADFHGNGINDSQIFFATNGNGQISFESLLTGPGVTAGVNDSALFATDPLGQLTLIARTGTPFTVAPGDVRTIQQLIHLSIGGGQDGLHSPFNDDGQYIFTIYFTDNTSGTFIANVNNNCTPFIFINPTSKNITAGQSVTFSVNSGGQGTVTRQWRRNNVDVVNDAQHSGAQTGSLTINPASIDDSGFYTCVITNQCGSTTSTAAQLIVTASPCGSSDFNGDGDFGTDADIEAFFACLGGNCCQTCGDSDFNGDGDFGTDADIEAFFSVLGGGGC